MDKKSRFSTYDMVVVGVMAAVCFATTYFFKITIPTPAGPVMLKLGNAFCLLAGLLFGGVRGGLASGIGSMMFDLMDPLFIADAPLTLTRFFLMAFICGVIAHSGGKTGMSMARNISGAVAGSVFSLGFYAVQSVIKLMLEGSVFSAALVAAATKLTMSSINAVIAVVIAVLIAPTCQRALRRTSAVGK